MLKNILSPIFTSFSKHKWQHKKPAIRIQGILESLEPGSPELENIAINDEDNEVKICAINRITSLESIQQVIKKTSNPNQKNAPETKAAHERFAKILSGETFPLADIVDRLEVLRGHIPSKICDYVAAHGKEDELRLIILDKIQRDSLLGDIALKDESHEVRLKAVTLISKQSTLQRVSKQARNKNKKVYHLAKQRLEQLMEDESRPVKYTQETINICEQLEKLYKRQLLRQEEHTFKRLKSDWTKVKNFANNENTSRYEELIDKIESSLIEIEQKEQQQEQLIQQLEELLQQLTRTINDYLELVPENRNNKEIDNIKTQWKQLLEQADKPIALQYSTKYHEIIKLLEQDKDGIETYSASSDLIKQLEVTIEQAENLSSNEQFSGKNIVENLFQKIDSLLNQINASSISDEESIKTLETKYQRVKSQLNVRLEQQEQQKQQLIKQLQSYAKDINQHLQSGETEPALKLRQQFQHLIDESALLTKQDKQTQLDSIKETQQHLSQLSSWKNWANERERENLCAQAQDVLNQIQTHLDKSPQEVETVYQLFSGQIKDLRAQWKQLKGKSDEKVWESFNNYCNQSYDFFLPYLEQQEEIRQNNVQAKEKICQQLHDYIQHMDWKIDQDLTEDNYLNTDWKQVDNILKVAKKEWHATGKVSQDKYKKLQNKFRLNQQIIEHQINQAWDRNAEKFEQLIQQAQDLTELSKTDLRQAINECKKIQHEWKKIGPTRQKYRKVLWKKFRQACDIVFNKRDEEREAKRQVDEGKQLEKTALCENLEALVKQELKPKDMQQAYQDILKAWQQISSKHNKKEPLTQRFSTAQTQYHDRISQLQEVAEQEAINLLKQKAMLCQQMEQQTLDKDEIDSQWQTLAVLDDKQLEKQISERFNQARENSESEQNLEDLIQHKKKLCLAMEILTQTDSPKKYEQERINFQIEQLNDRYQHNENNEELTINQLLISWHLLAEYDNEDLKTLSKRFFKAYGSS